MKKNVLIGFLILFSTQVVNAGNAADQKKLDKAMTKIKASEEHVEKVCGSKVSAKLDPSFKGEEAISTSGWCTSAVDAIGHLCADATYKAAVTKDIKSINCKYDSSLKSTETSGVKVQKSGSTVDVSWNKGSSNVSDVVKKYLEDNL